MVSKSGLETYLENPNETVSNEVLEGNSRRPSPLQISGTSKPALATPKKLPSRAYEVDSKKNKIEETVNMKSKNSQQEGPANHIASKLVSNLFLGDSKVLTSISLTMNDSLESMANQEKKISEHVIVTSGSASAKVSAGDSSLAKTSGSAKISNQADCSESGKNNMCRCSASSDVSDKSNCSSLSSSINKPHKANDLRWEAIQAVRTKDGILGLGHFRLLKRLGCADIGSVYVSELSGTKCYFAMKVMDNASLASRSWSVLRQKGRYCSLWTILSFQLCMPILRQKNSHAW